MSKWSKVALVFAWVLWAKAFTPTGGLLIAPFVLDAFDRHQACEAARVQIVRHVYYNYSAYGDQWRFMCLPAGTVDGDRGW